MSGPGIIWNREMFDALLEATSLAVQRHDETVRITESLPRRGFWKPATVRVYTVTVDEARQKLAELKPEFHTPDQPAREHNEGKEGE
jgi:hypothetical protein